MTDPKDGEGGRLKGWSQRKLDAKRQDQTPDQTPVAPASDLPEKPVDDPELIAALPSLDDITADFDMTPFLAKGVPASLKNAALRKLWRASPAVRDYFDPAVDYAWDWNAPGGVPGGGGVLSDESVAKMVKDLIGTPPKPADDAALDEIVALDPEVDQIDAAHGVDPETSIPEPAAVRRSDPAKAPPEATQTEAKNQTLTAENAAIPQRRHGGAVPD